MKEEFTISESQLNKWRSDLILFVRDLKNTRHNDESGFTDRIFKALHQGYSPILLLSDVMTNRNILFKEYAELIKYSPPKPVMVTKDQYEKFKKGEPYGYLFEHWFYKNIEDIPSYEDNKEDITPLYK